MYSCTIFRWCMGALSHTSKIGPRTCRSRRLKKAIICSPLRLISWRLARNFTLRERGVITNAPITLIRLLCSMLVRRRGVCPRGDQVRFNGETIENPLSSTKTRVALLLRHFFYMRPDVALPMCNYLIVTLHGDALRLLTTPAQPIQDVPNTAGVITDSKHIPD